MQTSRLVTNINGVLLLKFLDAAQADKLFELPTAPLKHKPYALNAVYLNMTDRCNLRCICCFAEERKESGIVLTFNDYKKILDEVARINAAAKIIFTGGEPLLSLLTLPVARYAKASGFDCRLMTNATLINEQNADELANLFETIKISVDGSDATRHDFYRGKGSYDRTTRAIDLLLKRGANTTTFCRRTRTLFPIPISIWSSSNTSTTPVS